jgi:esterase/lipase superfamily enzyme
MFQKKGFDFFSQGECMWLGLLLVSQFCLMSDRAFFWDTEKISVGTSFCEVLNPKIKALDSKEIEGKKVLLLVHGYNNDFAEALSTYQLINTHVSTFEDSKCYDLIIGYLWPGDDSALEYYDAKSRIPILAKRMRNHLTFLCSSAAQVDVLAHSMGNLLVLEALNDQFSLNKKPVQNFYALAPAVDDESIEKNEKYYFSTQNCEKIFVFFSKKDDVLKWCYHLAEGDRALGYMGAENPSQLPLNVQLINFSHAIDNHSQYFNFLPFYEFLKQQFLLHE